METESLFEAFMPHGVCYLWRMDILLLNVVSDGLIALAYFFIPFGLYYFFKEKKDFPFRNVILMFSVFIFTCGLSHVMGIWTVWNGHYGTQGLVKAATALASVATALMLVPVMPQLLALRSPRELETANLALTREIAERERSESQTRRFVEAAPDATLIVDEGGKIKVVNAQAEMMFGYPREELVGKSVNLLVPNPSKAIHSELIKGFFLDPLSRYMETGRELTGRKEDGSEFPIEVNLSAVGSEEKPLVSAAIRDITRRLELETQTRALEREIAHVGRLNTVGQMAAGLAHELNQPLTAITQNVDAALSMARQRTDIDPEFAEILTDLDSQAHRAGDIIRALREFVSKDDTSRTTFDFDVLVQQTLRLIDAEAKANDITVQKSIGDLPLIIAARVQIAQVLVNVLRNSIEAIAGEDSAIRRIMVTADRENGFIRVEVHDSGPGLANDVDVFLPFQTSKPEGMGLGLSISRSIIEAHGGRFWATTDNGNGACFCFTLPVSEKTGDA